MKGVQSTAFPILFSLMVSWSIPAPIMSQMNQICCKLIEISRFGKRFHNESYATNDRK